MRRRLTWLLAATLAVIAVPAPASSASDADASPRVHVAGIDRAVERGGPRREAIPWLVRPGSRHRGPASVAPTNAARSPLAPVVVPPTFDAVANLFPFASPADPTGALGESYHLAAVNVHTAFFDRAGVQFGPTRRLRGLDPELAGKNVDDFDPKVVYDPYRGHFLIVFLSATASQSFLSVVVIPEGSEGSTGQWCTLHMSGDQVTGNGKQFADYPMVGFTQGRVTITTNQFNFANAPAIGGFQYVQIISVAKSKLYDCDVPVVPIKVFSRTQTRDPDGSRAFTIVPAITVGGAPTAQFMTSIDFNGSTGKLILWRLRPEKGVLRLRRIHIGGGPMAIPPWGRQCPVDGPGLNDNWDTGDLRLTSSFHDIATGRVYTALARNGNVGGGPVESVIRWWEIDPASTLADSDVSRTGSIAEVGRDLGWPSVATDGDGNLWVNYARAGAAECLAAYASMIAPGATSQTPILIQPGFGRYEYGPGPERWGDYTAIARDPLDPTVVAAFGAYPIDDGVGGSATARWQQVIATLADA